MSERQMEGVIYAKPVKRPFDARVVAEFDLAWHERMVYDRSLPGFRERTLPELAEKLRDKCKEFAKFIRDHRSQDPVSLSVVVDTEEVCSICGKLWELMDGGCSWCGADAEPRA